MERNLLLMETSFEVVNKVGGIHTVLSSKASEMKRNVKNYFLLGPYVKRRAATEFEEEQPSEEFAQVFGHLEKEHGFKCRSGHWLITGRPKCILVEPGCFAKKTNDIKRELWDQYGIDSLHSGNDYNEPVCWGKAAGILIAELINNVFAKEFEKEKCVAHFHEWLSGSALLHLKQFHPEIKTVFTTHATVAGRSIAESGQDLYGEVNSSLEKGECMDESRAYAFGVQAKHLTEKACAHKTDVFTTVSNVTAREAEYVLGKKPHFILPNGLNVEKFFLIEELANQHVRYRNTLRRFVFDYFSPYYYLNVEDALFYFISGRHEFKNKGLDLFMDSLGELNRVLKEEKEKRTVIAFIWIPTQNVGKNIELLKHIALYERLEDEIEEEVRKIKNRLYYRISKGEPPTTANLLDGEFLYNVKKMIFELKHEKNDLPPTCALELEEENSITRSIKSNNLLNRKEDKVKVIYYPSYLSPTDGLIGLEYYQAIQGCHLGIFPSYYEPWGYTPLETIALGLPAATSDLSGFGRFVEEKVLKGASANSLERNSIFVVPREKEEYKKSVKELAEFMHRIYGLSKRDRGDAKIYAKRVSYAFDWSSLVENYLKAYDSLFKESAAKSG